MPKRSSAGSGEGDERMMRYMKDLNAEIQSQHQYIQHSNAEVTVRKNILMRSLPAACLQAELTPASVGQVAQLRASLQAAGEKCEKQAQQIEQQAQQIDALKAVLAQKRRALSTLEASAGSPGQTAPVQPAGRAEMQVAASMSATILSQMKGIEALVMEFEAAIHDADANFSRTVARQRLMEEANAKEANAKRASGETLEELTGELRSLYLDIESKHDEIHDLQEENSIVHARSRALQQELAAATQQLEEARSRDEVAAASSDKIRALESALADAQLRIRQLSLDSSSRASPSPSPQLFSSTDGSPSPLKPSAVGASWYCVLSICVPSHSLVF